MKAARPGKTGPASSPPRQATEGGPERGGCCFERMSEKGSVSVQGRLAAFCSSLCTYRWSGYSSSRVCKMKMRRGLQKPLESVLVDLERIEEAIDTFTHQTIRYIYNSRVL
jgi:hypothetical protein